MNPEPLLLLEEQARNGRVTPVRQSAHRRGARLMKILATGHIPKSLKRAA
jgi:hypothetical protein